MAFGRSNSLSINTGATNSLLKMPPARKMTRGAGYRNDDLGDAVFAAMPADIANNGFELSNVGNPADVNMVQHSEKTHGEKQKLLWDITPKGPRSALKEKVREQEKTQEREDGGKSVQMAASGAGQKSIFAEPDTKNSNPLADLIASARKQKEERLAREGGTGNNGDENDQGHRLTDNSSQQQQNAAPTTNSLFGNSTAQPANQTSGGLFGNTNTTQQSQPQQSGGLFGGTTAQSQPQQTGGLFGGNNTQSQPQQTGGLFGSTNTQSQPQQTGGLFGGSNAQQQQNQTANTGSLFGGNNASQAGQTGGLGGSLFGGSTQQTQNANTGGLFGGAGNSTAGNSLFGKPAQPTNSGTLFSSTTNQAGQSQPSLLGATQHSRLNQAAPFGRLSMGQSAAPTNTVGAVKVDTDSLRSTTRFDDCVDEVKAQLEQIDKMIQMQEGFCKQIEAFCPKHGDDINSITPDVEYVRQKADDVEQALISDAQGVDTQRRHTDKDAKDLERCHRIITNLNLPQPYQYTGGASMGGLGGLHASQQRPQQANSNPAGTDPTSYDVDLIGNYFVPMATDLQKTVNDYAKTLTEIESHMRVMESSAVLQAQQLAQQRNGMGHPGSQVSSEDTVRELADTLRGFEQSILGVAGVVGECREGVNELVLGRLGGGA